MSPRLHIELFGDFRLRCNDSPLPVALPVRLQSLLAYLALHRDRPQPRDRVAFLFWPDSSERQALTNLRHLLHSLRSTLPPTEACLTVDHRFLRWIDDPSVTLDVAEFARVREAGRTCDPSALRPLLESAAELFRGDLLQGATDDWIVPHRERFHRDATDALERLIGVLESARDYAAALRWAHRRRELDPTHEAAICALMRLHLLAGDRAAAIQAYKEGVAVLQRELAVGPGPAMRDLHARLLAGGTAAASAAPPAPARTPELPLHGRHHEWQLLTGAWSRAMQGHPQFVALLGEAGIGKSRLAEELCLWVERQGGVVARTRSYAAEGRLAFAPAAQWLRSSALRRRLAGVDTVWRAEVARILPEGPERESGSNRDTETGQESWRRHRLFEGLARAVLAGPEPLLLLLDDLQWTDPETMEWLRFLLRFAADARLLLVGTVRTEEMDADHPLQRLLVDLRRDEQSTEIQLGPLTAAEATLVAADVAARALSPEEARWLYQETEGNPLFVVERVRAGLREESGAAAAATPRDAGAPLPPKVHAVITTRLAQLSVPARDLAIVAAVVGRACSLRTLTSLGGRSEDEVVRALEELAQRRILRETAGGGYDFTHDKLREVTYGSASAARRQLLHRRTAETLERRSADEREPAWAEIAAHFEAGGLPLPARTAYRRAGETARRLHATDEAGRLFRKALALLQDEPASLSRFDEELDLHTALGVCLVASQGYPDAEAKGVYERAIELCRLLGRPTGAPILRALAIASLTSGDLVRAVALGDELLAQHAQSRDPIVFVEGHYVLGVSSFWLGRLAESREHLEISLAAYEPRARETHLDQYAQDPRAVCLCRLAWTLWHLGFPEQSARRLDEALALSRELQHPHTESYVLYFGAQLRFESREYEHAAELLVSLARLTGRHPQFFWQYRGLILQCFLRAREGPIRELLASAAEHLAGYERLGNLVIFPTYHGFQADLHLQRGDIRAGRAALADAFAMLERVDERYFLPELHRLQGELQGDAADAEACFVRALELARTQQSRIFELRAALSLGRLWRDQQRKPEAQEIVSRVYATFTEGFSTPDLREGKTFLASMRRTRARNANSRAGTLVSPAQGR